MPLDIGHLRSIIKGTPAPGSLIHCFYLLLLGNQVSVNLLPVPLVQLQEVSAR